MHNTGFLEKLRSLWERRIIRILWVVIVAVSCFVLGYTLKPRPSRDVMMRGSGMPPFGGMSAPPQMPPQGWR